MPAIDLDDILADVTGVASEQSAPEPVVSGDREGYAWAADIYWAYDHLGEKMTKAKAGTSGRFALWQYAKANTDQFLGTLLPKAMGILEKARNKLGDADIVEHEERKSVAEMQQLLKAAIEEAMG